ncbi:unnamed protein product, partial [Polarella glacialis]
SPLGCATPCKWKGLTATCHHRILWAASNTYAHQLNACGQAYSRVQVECDVCLSCSIQAVGCKGLSTTSSPFDCDAGYNNWHAGWSQPKKDWCCSNAHKGCAAAASLPYDCNAGLHNFHLGGL